MLPWFRKLFLRPANETFRTLNDHDPEWAEFNLPTRSDLQALFYVHHEKESANARV